MPILVCGISAFEFWRSRRSRDSPGLPGTPVPHLTQFGKPTREEVLEARRVLGLAEGDKLHVLVGNDPGRRHFSSYVCHFRSVKDWLPGDSLMQIGRGIWVVSPELLFLEASGTLNRIDLIRLGMELCSLHYAPDPNDRGRLELRDNPLTSASQMTAFLEGAGHAYGRTKALAAASLLIDGAASPREASLALSLSLPTKLGGFELPKPILNGKCSLGPIGSELMGVDSLRPDLLWPEAHVAIEYDSDEYHSSRESLDCDSTRRKALEASGLRVITFRNRDYGDFKRLYQNVRALREAMGMRNRQTTAAIQTRRLLLHMELRLGWDWRAAFATTRKR